MATTMTTEVPSVKNDKIVGAYRTQEDANYVRSEIESAGIDGKKLSIEGFIDPEAQVEAIGTTIGGEAGLLLGGLYGSFIGTLVATSVPYWTDIAADSGFNRLLIVGITAVSALVGWIAGKKELAAQSVSQKQKGDPGIPRSFCIVVDGSASEIDRARQVVEKSSAANVYGRAR